MAHMSSGYDISNRQTAVNSRVHGNGAWQPLDRKIVADASEGSTKEDGNGGLHLEARHGGVGEDADREGRRWGWG